MNSNWFYVLIVSILSLENHQIVHLWRNLWIHLKFLLKQNFNVKFKQKIYFEDNIQNMLLLELYHVLLSAFLCVCLLLKAKRPFK